MNSLAEIRRYIDTHQLQAAYQLLASRRDLEPLEAYYLAFCFKELNKGKQQEAINLFDTAEARGFSGFWLYFHRANLLASVGDHRRALQNATAALAQQPHPVMIGLALRSLAALSNSGTGALSPDDAVAVSSLLGAIWERLENLRDQIELINRKILNVDKGDFHAFVYEGDHSATPTPRQKMLPEAPLSPAEFVAEWRSSQEILLLLIAWYAAEGIPTAFLDIGSNIGTDAIRIAKFSSLINKRLPITSFEPGILATLVPHTLRLNGVDDIVAFEEKCVSDNNKPVVLFGEAGLSVNNRIVNRNPRTEGYSKIVNSTTVTEHLADTRFTGRHPILKVDTQGAEWFVWNGMKAELSRRWFLMIIELTPWALEPVVAPSRFVHELLDHFHVFDLGNGRQRCVPVTDDNVDEAIARISGNEPYWTDLLCISRSLESAPRLIDRIAGGYTGSEP